MIPGGRHSTYSSGDHCKYGLTANLLSVLPLGKQEKITLLRQAHTYQLMLIVSVGIKSYELHYADFT